MIAGIILIVLAGVMIERVLLAYLERSTVARWGMLRTADALAG